VAIDNGTEQDFKTDDAVRRLRRLADTDLDPGPGANSNFGGS
jgi:hypothetical protein